MSWNFDRVNGTTPDVSSKKGHPLVGRSGLWQRHHSRGAPSLFLQAHPSGRCPASPQLRLNHASVTHQLPLSYPSVTPQLPLRYPVSRSVRSAIGACRQTSFRRAELTAPSPVFWGEAGGGCSPPAPLPAFRDASPQNAKRCQRGARHHHFPSHQIGEF